MLFLVSMQNYMTLASLFAYVNHSFYQVYTQELVRSDKFKTGREQYVNKKVLSEEKRDVVIGRIPVMVKSNLCWLAGNEKGDCLFDKGGYFLIKGMEKVS